MVSQLCDAKREFCTRCEEPHNGLGAPRRARRNRAGHGAPAPRLRSGRPEHESKDASDGAGGSGGAKPPGLVRYATRNENFGLVAHAPNGLGAPQARPTGAERGLWGPRERRCKGVRGTKSPGLVRATVVCALLFLWGPSQAGAQMSDVDRQRLVAHLEMTAGWFLDEVTDLSRAQLEFRRAPKTWSIMEVIDHLVVVGDIYWRDLQDAVKSSITGPALSNSDADILWYGIDRTNREAAVASENPKGQLPDLDTALERYRRHHARLLDYARTTQDDLRSRFVPRQRSDAYQWALLISTHEQRHILQIREVKADPKFPKP